MALLTEISLVQGMLGFKQKLPHFEPCLLMGTPSCNNKYSPGLKSNLHSAAGWLNGTQICGHPDAPTVTIATKGG
jgi:hypothetical protein